MLTAEADPPHLRTEESGTRRLLTAEADLEDEKAASWAGSVGYATSCPACSTILDMNELNEKPLALAFDTANGVISIGIGLLDKETRSVSPIASLEESADRSSNTKLIPLVDDLFRSHGLDRRRLACVAVGLGPGSFTGVRIAVSTAKGIAVSLGLPLVGLSTSDAVAEGAWLAGVRGSLLVVDDAMRKEVYPAFFELDGSGIRRMSADRVVKTSDFDPMGEFASVIGASSFYKSVGSANALQAPHTLYATGDALGKYGSAWASESPLLEILPEKLWTPSGVSLLRCLQSVWRTADGADILDPAAYDPKSTLPVYTRLSDAEENERARLADAAPRDLRTGVQGENPSLDISAAEDAGPAKTKVMPFDAAFAGQAARMEQACMGTDAWNAEMIRGDIALGNRIWWMAVNDGVLEGYAGALVAGGEMELLKIAVAPESRNRGLASNLLQHAAEDARNLGAQECFLEVRGSNEGARAFYEALGFKAAGRRSGYYSDGEDAVVMKAEIRAISDVEAAGLRMAVDGFASGAAEEWNAASEESGDSLAASVVSNDRESPVKDLSSAEPPLILSIESSCDETAAAVTDGSSRVLSDVVASQVDFHARFGGVVPEIASRKHIEAIAAVAELALQEAGLSWHDLDSIAVTYAPGLIGALVIGVAFAKGSSWALDIPLVAVNHLEGHLYANRLDAEFEPPAVVSLVSGGNTMLVHMRDWGDYSILGGTIDDAVGEAFDKVAKAMGLPYPGGPVVSKLAEQGDPDAIDFPRALMHSKDYRFSLSGLKTAVMVHLEKARKEAEDAGEDVNLPDICASFQQAVIDVQVEKARRALRQTGSESLCIGGGVAANPALRAAYEAMCAEEGVHLTLPPLSVCGDNAVMIGLVAQDRYAQGRLSDLGLDAKARTDLSEPY